MKTLSESLKDRILLLDGAMGSLIQTYSLVEKDFRGNGIGHALLAAFMAKAKEAGYKKLLLWTASPLVEAISQYEALGFKSTERVENTTWSIIGQTVYEIKMETDI